MRKKGHRTVPFFYRLQTCVKRFKNHLVFALLVRYCAGSLASRLTGSLTLAAAALCSRSLQVCCIDGLDVLHSKPSPKKSLTTLYHKITGFSSVPCKIGKKFTSCKRTLRLSGRFPMGCIDAGNPTPDTAAAETQQPHRTAGSMQPDQARQRQHCPQEESAEQSAAPAFPAAAESGKATHAVPGKHQRYPCHKTQHPLRRIGEKHHRRQDAQYLSLIHI